MKSEAPPFSGGERDAINGIQLYRVTHDKKHLDLAKHYLDIRGLENSVNRSRHNQSYKPVLEQSEAVGHAVNDASLMVSLVDVAALTGIKDYFDAAQRIWLDAVGQKILHHRRHRLHRKRGIRRAVLRCPILSAYCETCAGIMFSTFNHKMFLATGDGKYIDVMERSMYNNVIDGVSASGNRFFLCQQAGERRRRTRSSLGMGFAAVLSSQSRQVFGFHAGVYLRPGQRRDLCEPVCLERSRRSRSGRKTCLSRSKVRCPGEENPRSRIGRGGGPRKHQTEDSRLGEESACPGRSLLVLGRGRRRRPGFP